MGFEQFIFPFVALIHRPDDADLVAQRLGLCRTYFVLSDAAKNGEAEAASNSATPPTMDNRNAFGLPTCIAAGFVAAAFVRCLDEAASTGPSSPSRPSALLTGVCRDLMALVVVEDSDFRTSIARILGFFDILTRPG